MSLLRAWREETKQHHFIAASSRGDEAKLMLGPIVDEFIKLIGVWDNNLQLARQMESLCEARENDVKSLS